jgi:hypothetical protein
MINGTTVFMKSLSYSKLMKHLLLLLLPVVVISCQKGIPDITEPAPVINCDLLRQGLMSNDTAMIRESLGKLLDETYSNETLVQLAATITSGCDITATLTCFDCIKTNPPQSEMQCSFKQDNESTVSYVVDLTPVANNTIKIVSVEQ